MRTDKRKNDEMRPVVITPNFTKYAEGSALIECGHTKVICTATVEQGVPPFLRDSGTGWVTAEYAMLPRATHTRSQRDIARLKLNARSAEIQRLIGRALRSVVALDTLGERSITVDCDVIQADGGTRCASITGGFVALTLALEKLRAAGAFRTLPLYSYVAAVSAGIVGGVPMLDLCYAEDSEAQTDFNFVMDDEGGMIEVQGTGEKRPFTKAQLDEMYGLAHGGVMTLIAAQKAALAGVF